MCLLYHTHPCGVKEFKVGKLYTYDGDQWVEIAKNGLDGADGAEVELRLHEGQVQWKYDNSSTWNNLIATSTLVGATGAAATVAVGTVTTVDPTDPATVTNVGTSGAAILDFEIPQGETGSVSAHDHDADYADIAHNHDSDYADIVHTHDDRYYTETETDSLLTGKAASSHTHPTTDLTATGGTSTSYLRKDNTWATPTNTTYSEISEAEITAGTASTSRTITGRRAGFLRNSTLAAAYPVNSIYRANNSTIPTSINAIGTWVQITANSGTRAVGVGGFSTPLAYTVEPRYEWKRTA